MLDPIQPLILQYCLTRNCHCFNEDGFPSNIGGASIFIFSVFACVCVAVTLFYKVDIRVRIVATSLVTFLSSSVSLVCSVD